MRRSHSMYVPNVAPLYQQPVNVSQNELVWRGQFRWSAKQNGQVLHREAFAEVTCQVFKGGTKVSGEGWPTMLQMQMIPKAVVNMLGQEGFFIGSKTVSVGLQYGESVTSLQSFMQAGHLGCVHVDSEMKNLFCPVKVFVLHCTGKGFLGVIPNDQTAFINRLRHIIQQKRNEAIQKLLLQQQCTMMIQQQQQQPPQVEEIIIESDSEPEYPANNGINPPDSPDSLPPENLRPPNEQNNVMLPAATVNNPNAEINIVNCHPSERRIIWNGTLQWLERQPGSLRVENVLRHVVCHVTSQLINGEPKVDGKFWPPRLVMQLIPKDILINICENGDHEMKSVGFDLDDCDVVRYLTSLMKSGFAGCVHFPPQPQSKLKLLILLYSKELQRYLGFVPTDQISLVTKIREVIVKKKEEIASIQAQQYKKIQAENAALHTLTKNSETTPEVISLEDDEISENTIAGAAEKALQQLTKTRSDGLNLSSTHHCTAFRLI